MYAVFLQCVTGEGDRAVWRAATGVIHSVFDQIPNLFTTTNKKPRREGGPQTNKHLPPNPFFKVNF
jgi:hypothetical protein